MNKHNAAVFCHDLLESEGLLSQGWSFTIMNSVKKLGECVYRDKQIRVSRKLINEGSDDEVIETIRHEVAHALAGPGVKHGKQWKDIALRLGIKNPGPTKAVSYTCHKYEVVCSICDKVLQERANRMPQARLQRSYCKSCGAEKSLGKVWHRSKS